MIAKNMLLKELVQNHLLCKSYFILCSQCQMDQNLAFCILYVMLNEFSTIIPFRYLLCEKILKLPVGLWWPLIIKLPNCPLSITYQTCLIIKFCYRRLLIIQTAISYLSLRLYSFFSTKSCLPLCIFHDGKVWLDCWSLLKEHLSSWNEKRELHCLSFFPFQVIVLVLFIIQIDLKFISLS